MPLFGRIVVIKRNGTDGTFFPLTATTCMFGRKAECDIRIQLPQVSKEHCKVEIKPNKEIIITNLSTVNPTQLNGHPLQKPVRLKNRDVITIIDRSFRFEEAPSSTAYRRSTSVDFETYQVSANDQLSNKNEIAVLEHTKASKSASKSEVRISRTAHHRRSLPISPYRRSTSSDKDLSPFSELYQMFKNKVDTKQNKAKTPVKKSVSSPKSVNKGDLMQAASSSQSPNSRRSRRSQGNGASEPTDAALTFESKDTHVIKSSFEKGPDSSESPSRSRRSLSKEKQDNVAVDGEKQKDACENKDVVSGHSVKKRFSSPVYSSINPKELSNTVQKSPNKRSSVSDFNISKQLNPSKDSVISYEDFISMYNKEEKIEKKRSLRKLSAEEVLKELEVMSSSVHEVKTPDALSSQSKSKQSRTKSPRTDISTRERRQSAPRSPSPKSERTPIKSQDLIENVQSPKKSTVNVAISDPGVSSKSKRVSSRLTVIASAKTSDLSVEKIVKDVGKRSPKKRKSGELEAISEPPMKRKRVSFGGHLSPELFDKRLPPNSPLKKGATPARLSLSFVSSPRAVIRKSFGLKQSVIKETYEQSGTSLVVSPAKRSPAKRSPAKTPSTSGKKTPVSTPTKIPSPAGKKSRVATPAKKSPTKTPSPAGKKSPLANPAKKSPSKTPSPAGKKSQGNPAKKSPANTPSPVGKRSPVATPAKKSPAKTPSPAGKKSLATPAKKSPAKTPSPAGKKSLTNPAKKSPAKTPSPVGKRSPVATPAKKSPAKTPSPAGKKSLATPAKKSPAKTPSPAGKKSPLTNPAKKSPAKTPSPAGKRSPVATPAKKSPAKTPSPAGKKSLATPAKKSPAKTPSPAGKKSPLTNPAKKSPAKTPSPVGKRSPVATPAKKSPAKTPSPAGKRSVATPAKKSQAKTPSPAGKRSPVATPAKKSPAKTPSPAGKRSPVATPAKKSPAKTPSPAGKKSLATPAKMSPAKTPSPSGKKSPLINPAKKSPAKTPSPAGKRPPVATPAKKSPDTHKTPSPAGKKSPLTNPAKKSPAKTLSPAGKKSPLGNPGKKPPSKTPSPAGKKFQGNPAKKSPAKIPSPVSKKSSTKKPLGKTTSPVSKMSRVATPVKKSFGKTPSPAGRKAPISTPAKTPSPASKKSPVATPARRSLAKTPSPVSKKSPVTNRAKTPSPAIKKSSTKKPLGKTTSPVSKMSRVATSVKKSFGKTPSPAGKKSAISTPAKTSSPASKKSPVSNLSKSSPAKTLSNSGKKSLIATPSKKVRKSPVSTPVKKSPVKMTSAVGKTPVSTLAKIGKKSPGKNLKRSSTLTPSKLSPAVTPAKRSPAVTPAKRSPAVTPAKRSPAVTPAKRSPAVTPAKRSPAVTPAKRSPAVTPAKRSPAVTPAKRSPAVTPAKRSPAVTPAKRSPAVTPAKRSPAVTPAKRSPAVTPAKRSPAVTPAKRSPAVTPAKRSPAVTPAKRSPAVTPAKRSPAVTPAKRSPAVTPAKRSPAVTPAKRSPAVTPAKRSPAVTPYMKGRFSVSRVGTPPSSQTPKRSRKSLTTKTPLRRSRKIDALEAIRSRRKSGASDANLFVARSWADVVKFGAVKSQKERPPKSDKLGRKVKLVKRKARVKAVQTPVRKIKGQSGTGHADSPATILIGRAHTAKVNITGHVPKVVRNRAVQISVDHDESFTGVADLFNTPINEKPRKSSRLVGVISDTPHSQAVDMSVMQTPEESGEMVVSPLTRSPVTTHKKSYNQDAVSLLLRSPRSPESSKENSTLETLGIQATKVNLVNKKNIENLKSKDLKEKRKTIDLTGIKRIMRTPKQKGKPVTDPVALKKMLRTPKQIESLPVMHSRRVSMVTDLVGVKRIMKTPKQKGEPVEDMVGIKRVMKTPRQKGEPVEDMVGIKRIMKSPRQKGHPVEDMIGIKRIMTTPKEKGQPVEDLVGISQIMSTPQENTHPIEEIFGIKQLIKTPPKKSIEKLHVSSPDSCAKSSTIKSRRSKSEELSVLTAMHPDEVTESSQHLPKSKSSAMKILQNKNRESRELLVEVQSAQKSAPSNNELNKPTPARRGRPSKRSMGEGDAQMVDVQIFEASSRKISSPSSRQTPSRSGINLSSSSAEALSQTKLHEDSPKSKRTSNKPPAKQTRNEQSVKALHEETQNLQESLVLSHSEVNESTPIRRKGRPSKTNLAVPNVKEMQSAFIVESSVAQSSSKYTPPKLSGKLSPLRRQGEEMPSNSDTDKLSPNRGRGRFSNSSLAHVSSSGRKDFLQSNAFETSTAELQELESIQLSSSEKVTGQKGRSSRSLTRFSGSSTEGIVQDGLEASGIEVQQLIESAVSRAEICSSPRGRKGRVSRSLTRLSSSFVTAPEDNVEEARAHISPKPGNTPQKQIIAKYDKTEQSVEVQNLQESIVGDTDKVTPTSRGRRSKSDLSASEVKGVNREEVVKDIKTPTSPKLNTQITFSENQNAEISNETPTRRGRPPKRDLITVNVSNTEDSEEQESDGLTDGSQKKSEDVKTARSSRRNIVQSQKSVKPVKSLRKQTDNAQPEERLSQVLVVLQNDPEKSVPARRGRLAKTLKSNSDIEGLNEQISIPTETLLEGSSDASSPVGKRTGRRAGNLKNVESAKEHSDKPAKKNLDVEKQLDGQTSVDGQLKITQTRRTRGKQIVSASTLDEKMVDLHRETVDDSVNELPKRQSKELPHSSTRKSGIPISRRLTRKNALEESGSENETLTSQLVDKSEHVQIAVKKRTSRKSPLSHTKSTEMNSSSSGTEESLPETAQESLSKSKNADLSENLAEETSTKHKASTRSTRNQKSTLPETTTDTPAKKMRGRPNKNAEPDNADQEEKRLAASDLVSHDVAAPPIKETQPVRRGRNTRNKITISEVSNDNSKNEHSLSNQTVQVQQESSESVSVIKPLRGKRQKQNVEKNTNVEDVAQSKTGIAAKDQNEKRSTRGRKVLCQEETSGTEATPLLPDGFKTVEIKEKKSTRGKGMPQAENLQTEIEKSGNVEVATVEPTEKRTTRGKMAEPTLDKTEASIELKGRKTVRGKRNLTHSDDSASSSVQIPVEQHTEQKKTSLTKSVQWHPLLTIKETSESILGQNSSQNTAETKISGRGTRSKKGKPETEEYTVAAKRSRRGRVNENIVVLHNVNERGKPAEQVTDLSQSISVTKEIVEVSVASKKGRKKGAQTNQESVATSSKASVTSEKITDIVASILDETAISKRNTGKRNVKSPNKTIVAQCESVDENIFNQKRGRAKIVTKKLDEENKVKLNTKTAISNKRGRTASQTAQIETSEISIVELSDTTVKKALAIASEHKLEPPTKSRRGLKRKLTAEDIANEILKDSEVHSQTADVSKTVTALSGRRGRNTLNVSAEKEEGIEKSPKKNSKAASVATSSATQRRGRAKVDADKHENEKTSKVLKTRASTRTRK